MLTNDAVWFITGCSKGLGRALAQEVLAAGYRLAATTRRATDIVGPAYRLLTLELDVTRPDQVSAAVAAAEARFGAVDVLVNNAGYGYLAAIEEGEDAEMRALFETDLFAPVNLVKAVLPGMRERRRGHVFNVTSVGGLVTCPAVGYYHMVKFGLETMSETLAKEVAPLGISVTAVAPGAFRTNSRGEGSMRFGATRIADYESTAGKAQDGTRAAHGRQAGDPVRAARAIIAAAVSDRPPVHLLLGGDALNQLRDRLAALRQELDAWEELTRGTDFPDQATA